ncbi:glycosyltransferase family 87 protein [Granulicella sibirica]|uniref:glycosyltransferase family 87 protein n=1 Tax=Granulicella sibirica TaxID=2479048 RepID=UPI0013756732|nr:glycosyltransferase family 87 protein [Granulicella sibirica]
MAAFLMMLLLTYLEARAGNPGERFGPLVDPLFGDLLEYLPTFRLLHSAAFFTDPTVPHVAYPPAGAALLALLYTGGHPVLVYLTVAALWLGIVIVLVSRQLAASGISEHISFLFPLTLLAVTFPVAGLLQRGNIELFVWILCASGCWAYRHCRNSSAAFLWGLAAAIKLYPILFLVLLLSRRKYRALFFGLGSCALTSTLAILYLGPIFSMAWAGSLHNVLNYQGIRISDWTTHDLSANHSVFTLLEAAAKAANHSPASLAKSYIVWGLLFFAGLYVTRLRRMPEPNQLLAVSVFIVAFPPTSYFYTLVELYPAFLVLAFLALSVDQNGTQVNGLSMTIQFFVPLFASFTLFTFRQVGMFGGPIQAFFLLVLLVCGAVFPFVESSAAV